jgi:uncharacterized protein YdeI (YjbR/CyaY-like superfamily)
VEVVQWRTSSARPRLSYDELVEEALCFGWIDSRYHTIDDRRSAITMTPRRKKSAWASSNKARVARLTQQRLMTEAGLRVVEAAKADGSWSMLDDVEALIVPDDLAGALAQDPAAERGFSELPPSAKKQILYWIKTARRPQTRQRRIAETVGAAAEGRRPGPVAKR